MKVRVLIFDTETTGRPKHFGAPEDDLNNYPYLIQYCGELIEVDLEDLSKYKVIYSINCLVRPEREGKPIKIEEGAFKVHGITEEQAELEGNDISHIAMIHQGMCNTADFIVAHNYQFDRGVIVSELLRLGIQNTAKRGCMAFCTMKYSTNILKIESSNHKNFKFPSLKELYKYYTERNLDDDHKAHDAQGDVNATVICLMQMINNEPELLKWFRGEIKTIY